MVWDEILNAFRANAPMRINAFQVSIINRNLDQGRVNSFFDARLSACQVVIFNHRQFTYWIMLSELSFFDLPQEVVYHIGKVRPFRCPLETETGSNGYNVPLWYMIEPFIKEEHKS